MNKGLDWVAGQLEAVASELEEAVKHARIAADHFRNKEVPRGAAHTFAIEGHMEASRDLIREFALHFRTQASTERS